MCVLVLWNILAMIVISAVGNVNPAGKYKKGEMTYE